MENDELPKPAVDVSAFTPLQQYYYAEQLRAEITATHFDYMALQSHTAGDDPEEVDISMARALAERRLARAWRVLRENNVGGRPSTLAYVANWPDVVADATVAAAKAAPGGLAECQQELRRKGNPYPRTCKVCGLGPCHYQGKTP